MITTKAYSMIKEALATVEGGGTIDCELGLPSGEERSPPTALCPSILPDGIYDLIDVIFTHYLFTLQVLPNI